MSSLKTLQVDEPFVELDCTLGEGPYWEQDRNVLFFVDIHKNQLHSVDLNIGPLSHKIVAQVEAISTTAGVADSSSLIACGARYGYGLLDKSNGSFRYMKKVWNEEEIQANKHQKMRANDGKVDSRGRFWLGMMSHPLTSDLKAEGALFRLDPDMTLHRMIDKVTIPNGISWTSDDKTMYFTDSPEKCIFAYDFDTETGNISNKRIFFKLKGQGVPDGHAQDVQGNLWVAIFGQGKVLRISPPSGAVTAEINLPTRLITCPVFAGEDLYITTAAEREPETFPESAKYGGSLFKCHVGTIGKAVHQFRLQET